MLRTVDINRKVVKPRDLLEVQLSQLLLGDYPIHKVHCISRPRIHILAQEKLAAQPCQTMADNT